MRVATIRGVDLRVDPSWLLVLVVLVLAYRPLFATDGRSVAAAVTLAAVSAALFALSVVVHEFAHALEGSHRGAEVAGITLFALGGATALRGGDRRARDEFAIAAIGPWSNIVLAAVAGLVATGADELGLDAVAEVAGLIGWLNLGLALFNLVPGAPLDGGRVLRAAIWAVTGDRHRATIAAAWAGIGLALALFGVAVWGVFGGPGGLFGALWTTAVAAYVFHASNGERVRGRLGRWLARRRADSMAPPATRIGLDATVGLARGVVDEHVGALLVDDGGAVGFVPAGALEAGDPDDPLAPLVVPLDDLPRVDPDGPADQLANLLDRDRPFVLVTPLDEDDGRTWLSSLGAVDQRIQEALRREHEGAGS